MILVLAAGALVLTTSAADAAPCDEEDCPEEIISEGPWVSGPISEPGLAVHRVVWSDFSHIASVVCHYFSHDHGGCGIDEIDNALADGDHIWLREEAGASFGVGSSEIEVVLSTGAGVVDWKEIKAFDSQRRELRWIDTAGAANHGPVSMRLVVTGSAPAHSLVFSKLKQLGFRTGMYQLFDLSAKAGKRLSFFWASD